MRFLPERTFSSALFVASLALILIVLAALQYRWSGQVSKAEHERMHSSLLASANHFRLHFNSELHQLGMIFQLDADGLRQLDWSAYAMNCDRALSRCDAGLIRNIYIWTAEANSKFRLLKLDAQKKSFEESPWPENFGDVRGRYERYFADPFQPASEIRPLEWTMFYRIPLMLQPLLAFRPARTESGADIQFYGFLLLELDLAAVRDKLLSNLARRYFEDPSGFDYQIGIATGEHPDALLYASDPRLTVAAFSSADVRMRLFENGQFRLGDDTPAPEPDLRAPGEAIFHSPLFGSRPSPPGSTEDVIAVRSAQSDRAPGWELLVKHRAGSLDDAVARNRKWNLAVSMGSLLLLAFSMALIIVSARRAQRLARLQIEFVASISHELRTPLSVICSAGDNLAEGVTGNSSDSRKKYGELIRSEGRKLTGMIEHILQFASLQKSRHRYNLNPEDANAIVEASIKQANPAILGAGFCLEKHLARDLPRIRVDAAVLMHLIQNLIQNAVKYSGESRWLAVRTAATSGKRGKEVRIIIEDRGVGIDGEDLPHVFEAFYRGRGAIDEQIHGTGLGLFMVREATVSMGGKITAKSSPGKGSVFTMHFPALPASTGESTSAVSEEQESHAI